MSEKERSGCCIEEQRVLELAMEMGQILLQSGAEIFRVEDTMRRVCRYYGMEDFDLLVVGNGILSSTRELKKTPITRIRYTPFRGARFNRIVAINQLSREISEGKYPDIEEAERRVAEIEKMPVIPNMLGYFGSALAAGSFCVLFGGGIADTVTAFVAGWLLHMFLLHPGKHMSSILSNILGGAIISVICLLSYRLGFGENLSHMMSGGILPLVPGVAFTNGIRDIGSGDYHSGTVRLLDALWTFICIAIGVGAVFGIYQQITGGTIL